MSSAFTILWTQDRCQAVRKHGQEGKRLEVLFGGPHTSEPSFRRYGVKEGDYIYPVRLLKGTLYVIGRMRVKHLLSLAEYVERYSHLFEGCEPSDPVAVLGENCILREWVRGDLPDTIELYRKVYPCLRNTLPSPTDEHALTAWVRTIHQSFVANHPQRRDVPRSFAGLVDQRREVAGNESNAAAQRVQPKRGLPEELARLWHADGVFENYLTLHPELRYLAPTCTGEVAVGEEGTPIRPDNAVLPEVLERLSFRSRRGERPLKHVEDGRLKSIISLQGIYRLSDASAADFETLVLGGAGV
jgi:hypothetical protein